MATCINVIKDYIIENENVLLQPLQFADLQNLVKFSIEEPELWQYSLTSAAGVSKMERYIQDAVAGRVKQLEYPFIVFDKKQNKYAGSTRFYDIQPFNKSLQLGFTWYGKEHQGTGLNKNCKYLLLQHAFETWQVERVEFRADNENKKSIAAMKSIGCTVEGVLRSHLRTDTGKRRDSIVLSILMTEWFNKVKRKLAERIS